jgi:hypothetical protein
MASKSGFGTNTYLLTWAFTEPVLIAALIAFTLECYGLVHHHYPGFDDDRPLIKRIVVVGRWFASCLWFPIFGHRTGNPDLPCSTSVERTVTTLGAMLMVLVVGAYMFMPVLMPPNIIRHAKITLAYLTINTLAHFGVNVFWGSKQMWSWFYMAADVLCFVLWAAMLTRQGQIEPEPDLSYEEDLELELSWEELREISQQAPRLRFRWFGWFRSKGS